MKKGYLIFILISIFSVTAILVILGFIFNKSEFEKQEGLADVFDISSDGVIAYVSYEKGKPGVYFTKNDEKAFNNPVLQLDVEQEITDVDFSLDGSSLAYIESKKDTDSEIENTVYLLDMETLEKKLLFSEQALITEIEFDPKEKDELFYLRAGTFENYSPVARANPHDFDIFSYQLSKDKKRRHTKMKKYGMQSLQVSASGNTVFVQMDDDVGANTAEDVFATKQRVFEVSLDQPESPTVVSKNDRNVDIYDFAMVPNKSAFIFQAVSTTNEEGTYEYELFQYNWNDQKETQLTHLKESASNPVIGAGSEKVLFMVDRKFGETKADYHLYQMDLDGENVEEIALDF